MAFRIGDTVSVEKPNYLHCTDHESGVVFATDCDYTDSDGKLHRDGIMVKFHISNTKETFPPACVKTFQSSPPPSSSNKRRRGLTRRARVTPSPVIAPPPADQDSEMELNSEKRDRETDEEEGKPPSPKKSKFFTLSSSEEIEEKSNDSDASAASCDEAVSGGDSGDESDESSAPSSSSELVQFRVSSAPSSASKCKYCQKSIRKKSLRMQPSSAKRGWYHATCVTKSFDRSKIQPATQMEGFQKLSRAEKESLKKAIAGIDVSEDEDEDEKGEQAPPPERQAPLVIASDTDSNDEQEMPYRVEYATTGRATCKGCDERIQKQVLRVSNRPLFRGKPGFLVYRHLHCTVFSENIETIQDVGGWRKISKEDQKKLAARIEESKELIQKENEELRPDELVQAAFQGEIRSAPPGLAANLLPFQVEGTSWMHHQEVAVPEIRGGILSDEMGMGKSKCLVPRS